MFNGNEASYLRWKDVFDVLKIGNARDVCPDISLEQQGRTREGRILYEGRHSNSSFRSPSTCLLVTQVLRITKSEDLVKLRALAKLCSREFFEDPSLSVPVSRRIL